jgi:two-component system osmolarity sensor histidine kinase EnvZ
MMKPISALDYLMMPVRAYKTFARAIAARMPKGLFARALIIIIAPMVLLQSVVAYIFMERHWQTVTQRLSAAVTQDIAAIVDLVEADPSRVSIDRITEIAAKRMGLTVEILPADMLPAALPKPFFSILDSALSDELRRQIRRPFWLDTVGSSNIVEIRIQIAQGVLRILTKRSQAYASNSHIFIMWMVVTSCVLILVAILFLRNQIRPILALAQAAESFGKGRDIEFRPRGAREVRQAGLAFIEMKRRIERAIEQRTTMLNGVSHDLRTILTRFRLSLEMMEDDSDRDALKKDVDEMTRMLEGYLAFARGDMIEQAQAVNIRHLLEEMKADAERQGHKTTIEVEGDPVVTIRVDGFRRCLGNLMANAARHADRIAVSAAHDLKRLTVNVDDDGPGIPEEMREAVFKPFFRLDEARNIDDGGSGLGLAIARDIARSHGGEITLSQSPMGGLRASVRIPL